MINVPINSGCLISDRNLCSGHYFSDNLLIWYLLLPGHQKLVLMRLKYIYLKSDAILMICVGQLEGYLV